jgi:hypothetical protein
VSFPRTAPLGSPRSKPCVTNSALAAFRPEQRAIGAVDPAAVPTPKRPASSYWPWAELLARTFSSTFPRAPKRHGRMTLLAMVTEPRASPRIEEGWWGRSLSNRIVLC